MILKVSLYSDSTIFYEIVHGGTLGGVPSWSDVNTTNSGVELDVSGTTVTGGVILDSGYLSVSGGSSKNDINIPLTNQILCTISATGVQDNFSIVCTSFTGTANCAASITFQERR